MTNRILTRQRFRRQKQANSCANDSSESAEVNSNAGAEVGAEAEPTTLVKSPQQPQEESNASTISSDSEALLTLSLASQTHIMVGRARTRKREVLERKALLSLDSLPLTDSPSHSSSSSSSEAFPSLESLKITEEQEPPLPPYDCFSVPERIFNCGLPARSMIEPLESTRPSLTKKRLRIPPSKEQPDSNIPTIECIFGDQSELPLDVMSSTSSVSATSGGRRSKSKPTCPCHHYPPMDAAQWPQAPLLLRPTPNSGTRIQGVRYDDSSTYFWEPHMETTWWQCLQQQWGQTSTTTTSTTSTTNPNPCCELCAILPINNGNEQEGKAIAIDFESNLFQGSLLLRLRFVQGTTPHKYDDRQGFFANRALRYQAIIRGKFTRQIPFTSLTTGNRLERPCGKLPPKWLLWSGFKFISLFAPQLDSKIEGPTPYTISPLGSTPRTILVDDVTPTDLLALKKERTESLTDTTKSITGKCYPLANALERARARKKAFDQLYATKSQVPMTDPSKTYTFEFLQHLFDYTNFSIDIGSVKVELKDVLNGQPMQIMAEWGDQKLWSFDLWNECLLKDARKYVNSTCP
jgi:hypothetical protein